MLGQMLFEYLVFKQLEKRKDEDFVTHTCALWFLSTLVYEKIQKRSVTWWPWQLLNSIDKNFASRNWMNISNGDAFLQIESLWYKNLWRVNLWINSIFLEKFNDSKRKIIRSKLKMDSDRKYLIFVGRFVPIKNIFFMLWVFKLLYESDTWLHLILVWEGDLKSEIEDYISKNNLWSWVTMVPFMKHEQLKEYYQASDLFLLTSTYDNFPLVITEAMATWLPVVASKVWWIPLIVEDGKNWYAVPLDNNLFAETISDIIHDDIKLKQLWENAHKLIKSDYSWEKSFEAYEGILKNVK